MADERMSPERYWIVFDGPPGQEPGRFVEVENDQHEGRGPTQTGAAWQQDADTFWRLGPFVSTTELKAVEAERDRANEWLARMSDRRFTRDRIVVAQAERMATLQAKNTALRDGIETALDDLRRGKVDAAVDALTKLGGETDG